MTLRDSLAAGACRTAVHNAYYEGRAHAERLASRMPPHWWGLCDALSTHGLSHGRLLPEPALWSELTPFLLITDDEDGVSLLAEYAVFTTHAGAADIERLALAVNAALHRVDVADDRVVSFLRDAMEVHRPGWLALLSYETFRWVKRTLAVARSMRRNLGTEWLGKAGPLWLKRGPREVESEAFGSPPD
jgi:hypothetical protein